MSAGGSLRLIVLGSAAGGGFPQWNSAGPGCTRARAADPAARPRTQCSLAASMDGERWVLFNAAPEILAQIAATPVLHPRPGEIRNSPIRAVVLTGGEIDTIAGLLSLRERQSFAIYGSPQTLRVVADNPIFRALDETLVPRRLLEPGGRERLRDGAGQDLGIDVLPIAVPGKVPLFLEDGQDPGVAGDGETLGLVISAGQGRAAFVPGCAAITQGLRGALSGCEAVLFDGTLWRDDEMILAGAGSKTGRRMGHVSVSGPNGVLSGLADVPIGRRILIHINNTNPVLLADSPERAAAAAAGWEVAEDGMEILL